MTNDSATPGQPLFPTSQSTPLPDSSPAQNGSPDVIATHFDELRQIEIEGYELAVKKARNALFITGGLILLWEFIAMYREFETIEPITAGFAVVVAGIFVALGLWTKKKPYTALIAGLIAFILYMALAVVANGMAEGGVGVMKALVSGIIVKVIILINLIRPLKDAKLLQEAKQVKY